MAEHPKSTTTIEPKDLLADANSASEKVATLHVTFIAFCTYVIVTVFGTTDVDLLLGRGIKLPIVDVEVPIVGFYFTMPYLLVLVHFNLLMSLQLLSRKLHILNGLLNNSAQLESLRVQLSIFPYSQYLIGRSQPIMRTVIASVVIITVLIVPLTALLALQARFLGYQDVAITWAQRLAIWLDVAVVLLLWPVITDPNESWVQFRNAVWRHAKTFWLGWTLGLSSFGFLFWSLLMPRLRWGFPAASTITLLLTIFVFVLSQKAPDTLKHFCRNVEGLRLPAGTPALLMVVMLGISLPIILRGEGEGPSSKTALERHFLHPIRYIELPGKVLLANQVTPDIVTDLRGADQIKREIALKGVSGLQLHGRSLRGADFSNAVLTRANLRGANLQGVKFGLANLDGADLRQAQLQAGAPQCEHGAPFSKLCDRMGPADLAGARMKKTKLAGARMGGALLRSSDLEGADMGCLIGERNQQICTQAHNADFSHSNLQSADLTGAFLRDANLENAQMQGADVRDSTLHGANLRRANLDGASMQRAKLEGADLTGARLVATNLTHAHLEAAILDRTIIDGADLRKTTLFASSWLESEINLVDIRGAISRLSNPLDTNHLQQILQGWQNHGTTVSPGVMRLTKALQQTTSTADHQPPLTSCLRIVNDQLECYKSLTARHFEQQLVPKIIQSSCASLHILMGVLNRLDESLSMDGDKSTLNSYAYRLNELFKANKNNCLALTLLSIDDRKWIETIVIGESDVRRLAWIRSVRRRSSY